MDYLTLGRVLWRSFFLQAAWNYKGQQSLGLTASLIPALEKHHGQGTLAARDAVQRIFKPFNTHPYVSGPILGMMVRLEEQGAESGYDPERLERLLRALSTGLAAIGDGFFWVTLLPSAAVVGMFWALDGHWAGALVFLAVFNLAHLTFRIWGFRMGYKLGMGMTRALDRLDLHRRALGLRILCSGALGLLAARTVFLATGDTKGYYIFIVGIGLGAAVWGCSLLLRRRMPVEVMIYGIVAGAVAWNYLTV